MSSDNKPSKKAAPKKAAAPAGAGNDDILNVLRSLQSGDADTELVNPFGAEMRPAENVQLLADYTAHGVPKQDVIPYTAVIDQVLSAGNGNGIPTGCTIVVQGPPSSGKTRTAMRAALTYAAIGKRCAYVVAEEGFQSPVGGRLDFYSKLSAMAKDLKLSDKWTTIARNLVIIEAQFHKNVGWNDFVNAYKYAVAKLEAKIVIVDSITALDSSGGRVSDRLAKLKTFNHDHGVTCVVLSQMAGSEALVHVSDAFVRIEDITATSKEHGAEMGVKYRESARFLVGLKTAGGPLRTTRVPCTVDNMGCLAVRDVVAGAFSG
jgi:KaiC/GvpD/RAD55 family RecA-like ATPase